MAKKQDTLTSFKPQNYSGFVQSTLALEKAKAAAQDPTAGFAALANPILQELGRQVQVSEEAKNTFLENMPDDFQVELVSPELKGELTNQLNTYKSEYLEGVELLSKYANNPNSEEYRRGVEIAEGAKNKMMNTYNGLVKLQQDRAYEIDNANIRGWNDPAKNIIANKLVVGLSADQVSYDDQGNPIYNAGIGEPINVFDYKRTRARDLELSNALFNTVEIDAYKAGSKNMNKDLFNRTIDHQLASIKMNKEGADELFYIGVDGDTTGQTAPKNYIQNWDGLPPSKSPETMRKMIEHLRSTADLRYNDGLKDARKEFDKSSGRSRAPLSEARIAEINIFKNSLKRAVESGEDITFPNKQIGKITSGGNIQLYKPSGEKLEILPISLDQALDRADIPVDMREDIKQLSSQTSTKGGRYSKYKNNKI